MTHPVFGELLYDPDEAEWFGFARLPGFAALAGRPDRRPPPDLDAAVARRTEQLERDYAEHEAAPRAVPTPPAEDHDTEWDEPDPTREEQAADRRGRRREKLTAFRRHQGLTPVRLPDPDRAGPSPPQEAAFRHLADNEARVLDAIRGQVFEALRSAYGDDYWRRLARVRPAESPADLDGRFRLAGVEITREHHNGVAYLVVPVDADDWADEHGLLVVYHPDRPPAWGSFDDVYDLTESDEPPPAVPPTPHQQLFEAVAAGDAARVAELRAAGADLNAPGPGDTPPLCLAVLAKDPGLVERLLAAGADPNIPDPEDGRTPLRKVRREMRDLGFRRAARTPWYMWPLWLLMWLTCRREMAAERATLTRIERLLAAAGGR